MHHSPKELHVEVFFSTKPCLVPKQSTSAARAAPARSQQNCRWRALSEPSAGSLLAALLGALCDGQSHILGALGSPQQDGGCATCVSKAMFTSWSYEFQTVLLIAKLRAALLQECGKTVHSLPALSLLLVLYMADSQSCNHCQALHNHAIYTHASQECCGFCPWQFESMRLLATCKCCMWSRSVPTNVKARMDSRRVRGAAARLKNSACSDGYLFSSSCPYSSQDPVVSSRSCSHARDYFRGCLVGMSQPADTSSHSISKQSPVSMHGLLLEST